MALQKYVKTGFDRKRYQIDYAQWLDTGEQLTSVMFSVQNNTTPALVVDDVQVLPSGLGVQYYVSGGVDGRTYSILVDADTTIGPQEKRDEILMTVRGP